MKLKNGIAKYASIYIRKRYLLLAVVTTVEVMSVYTVLHVEAKSCKINKAIYLCKNIVSKAN